MMEIYGKEYAIGKSGETIQDALDNMENEGDVPINIGAQSTTKYATLSKRAKKEKTPKGKDNKKLTKSASGLNLACLQTFMENMNVHLSTMASTWSCAQECEQEMVDKNNKVLDELLNWKD